MAGREGVAKSSWVSHMPELVRLIDLVSDVWLTRAMLCGEVGCTDRSICPPTGREGVAEATPGSNIPEFVRFIDPFVDV